MGWLKSSEPSTSAGASGAICGVIGAALVIGVRTQGWSGPVPRAMGFWLGLTFLFGLQPGVDNAAHVGGAACGAAIAAGWRRGFTYTRFQQKLVVGACATLLLACAVVVAARDLFDPWALLDARGRMDRARRAERAGRCAEAQEGIERAGRILPRQDARRALLKDLAAEYVTRCRTP
jgi:rhomboid protease GluP